MLFAAEVEIIIPPPENAILSPDVVFNPTLRDRRIAAIASGDRIAWQVKIGYNQRSRRETRMGR